MKKLFDIEVKFEAIGNPNSSLESSLKIFVNGEEVKPSYTNCYSLKDIIKNIKVDGLKFSIDVDNEDDPYIVIEATKGTYKDEFYIKMGEDEYECISTHPSLENVETLIESLKQFKNKLTEILESSKDKFELNTLI